MINYDSILSAFDGKPTLLQWLKMVKKALDESVTGVDEVSNEVVGGQTLTTLRFNFSNGTNDEVVVHAENGKDASSGKLYRHNIHMAGGNGEIYFTLYTSQEAAYTSVNPVFAILGNTPYQFVYYNGEAGNGIGVVTLILDIKSFNIKLYKSSSSGVTTTDTLLQTPSSISDTVIEV